MKVYVLKAGSAIVLEECSNGKRSTSSTILRDSVMMEASNLCEIEAGTMHFRNVNTHCYVSEKDVLVLN